MASKSRFTGAPVAYYRGFGGLEVYDIVYGIYDTVLFTLNAWYGRVSYHSARVRYNAHDDAYFLAAGQRVYLRECLHI